MAQAEAKHIKVRRVDFYPDDWIAGTVDLSHDERSVYISICVAIWSQGGAADEKYVRQLCGYSRVSRRHFSYGLQGLLAKGKVSRIQTETGEKLTQTRAETELDRARLRTEIIRNNGAKGGRPKGLPKPGGFSVAAMVPDTAFGPELVQEWHQEWCKESSEIDPPKKRRSNGLAKPAFRRARDSTTIIKRKPSSSVGEVAAHASSPNGGCHARDTSELAQVAETQPLPATPNGWTSLGEALGDTPPPNPPTFEKICWKHDRFLRARGRPDDVALYWAAMTDPDPNLGQRIFDLTDARMRKDGWDDSRERGKLV